MPNSKKVMLIGWDAADWKVIHPLMDEGLMPNVKRMIEGGTMGNMRTLSPVLSPMLWTSIATGMRPFKHGIYGFTEPTADQKSVQPMTNSSRKVKSIWNILNQNDMESIVVGWWPSHPAEPIDGCMVSDFYCKAPKKPGDPWNLLPKTIHPQERFQEVAEMRIHPQELTAQDLVAFVPHIQEVDQQVDSRLSMVMKILAECTSVHGAATHLLETQPWDFAAIYYDAIDHFCHGFMKYHPPQREAVSDQDFKLYQNVVRTGYIYHDMMLGRLMELGGEETTYILMSDHGFHPDHLRPDALPSEPAGPAIEHRDYGVFLAHGPGVKQDGIVHGANLLDVTPTILTMFDLPVGEDMDGRPLIDIFTDKPDVKTIPSWEEVNGNDGQHPKDMVIDPEESKAAMEQLIALGYVERPDANSAKAVKQCTRELDFNLARSYMDAGMHGEAIPILLSLYQEYPLEFRYGIQLANCLRATGRFNDLEVVINDLNGRWRVASTVARKRFKEFVKIGKERKQEWLELKKIDEQNEKDGIEAAKLAKISPAGRPIIFNDAENFAFRKLRSVSRGNPQTLDFLAASVATSKGDFETALELLERAKADESQNPGLLFHVGNVYIGLKRYADAEKLFVKALEIDEFHPNSLMGLCRNYVEMGSFEKAIEIGRQAIGLKFQFPVAHYFLGMAYSGMRDRENAVTSLQTAIEQNPNFEEAHQELASIYSNGLDLPDKAVFHAEAAEKLAQQNSEFEKSSDPIQLPEINPDDFEEHLPELPGQGQNTDDFLVCLSQPRDKMATQERNNEQNQEVIIVSGLPRSGTSMMMQMLSAGGMEPYTDKQRLADESNPKGYFEAENVKQLASRNNWLGDCQGKVVKIVAPLIPYLPQNQNYRVVFMARDINEIVNSQNKMLERLNTEGGDLDTDRLATIFSQQASFANNLLKVHGHEVFQVDYKQAIENPAKIAAEVAGFVGNNLNPEKMVEAVDPSLYRERGRQK